MMERSGKITGYYTLLTALLLLLVMVPLYFFLKAEGSEPSAGPLKETPLLLMLGMVFLVSLIPAWFLGRYISGKALRPLKDFESQLINIDASHLDFRLKDDTGNEDIDRLAATFNEMLDRIDSAFSGQEDFIANVSHELRTPLTSVTGQIEVGLLKERSVEEYKQTLQSVLEDIKNLNSLTNRLLVLLRAESIKEEDNFTLVRVDDILWKARSECLSRNKNYQAEILFDKSIGGENHLSVHGNPDLLKTAFVNLIENGCKYSPSGKVEINLLRKEDRLQLCFRDEGIGIPEKELALVLLPFYRASNAVKRGGHGIGLSLVDRIVAAHKGSIDIESEVGKGTLVKMELEWEEE